jgi:hypothetical protein
MHRSNARARVRRRVRPSSVAWLLAVTLAAPISARAQDMTDTTFKIRYKGLTLTPIGYFAGEAVWRQKNITADITSNFNSIPFSHSTNGELSEFRGSARQSRIGLAAEGKPSDDVRLQGYWESDFLSSGITSNSNESNSYTLRIRQFWGGATIQHSSFYAGQMWSLMTPMKNGAAPRSEAVPLTIDAQYNLGFNWARQWGVRFVQDFNKKAAFAIGAEEDQMTVGGHGIPADVFIGNAGGSLLNSLGATYSADVAPDVVAKLAFDPGPFHFEIKGIGRFFRDRIVDTAAAAPPPVGNIIRVAGGVGAGLWVPFMYENRDVLDIGVSGLWGNGIGRYGTGQLPDATTRADGTIVPIRNAQGLVSIEAHPTKKLDIFLYGGSEYEYRMVTYTGAGKAVGYGAPTNVNSGCDKEYPPVSTTSPGVPGALCNADTRDLWEATAGFWYSFIRSAAYGRFAWGLEYHYISRNTWSGANGIQPQAIDPTFFTSFRYYIP